MTRRDEAIRLARIAASGEPISGKLCCELTAEAWAPFFDRFAALVAAAERERCAQACEAWGHECHGEGRDDSEAFDCADLIRALKDGEE